MTNFLKNIKIFLLVTLGIYAFDQTRMWITGNYESLGIYQELIRFSYYFLYSFVIGTANIEFIKLIDKKYTWNKEPKKRAIYGFLGAMLVTMLSLFVLRIFTVIVIEQKTWNEFTNETATHYFYSLSITFVVILIFYVIHFYKALAKKSITVHKTIAQTEIAKYESLKNQLDPHFLFNSLNVLTSLIEENPEKAERFTTKLSKVYRYVLEQKEKTLVPIFEELEFAKNYIELMNMRFEDSINFEIDRNLIKESEKIIPLSLQLLLENAIKHNQITKEKPLNIQIQKEANKLIITNNHNPKHNINKGTGIGLQNINERYALLTNNQVAINTSNHQFSVSLPILTQKSEIMKTTLKNEQELYDKAKEKVMEIKSFYTNATSYTIVISFLAYVNFQNGWEHKWFLYPAIGWGIGLLFHYFRAFNRHPFFNKNWEEKQIKKIIDREQQQL